MKFWAIQFKYVHDKISYVRTDQSRLCVYLPSLLHCSKERFGKVYRKSCLFLICPGKVYLADNFMISGLRY